eukprot:TRINITY_DN68161_c0_g1_i1.p1 TRINITY_DN68161_c0_g1~~TRINITY_DN68161_c0_g1_i1.p1  ORF type:complete len:435 (+),score=61.69 TRINITY_DN68161_c0_g1_i1:111-1307(+)
MLGVKAVARRQNRRQWSIVETGVSLRAFIHFICVEVAVGWDKDGHEAIGMTTMSALEAEPMSQIKRLMHGKDAVEIAAWAHKVNKKFPWTSELHFQRQPTMTCEGADLSLCPGNRCLVKALQHFFGRLVNKPLVEIDWGAGIKLTDSDCLKYIINLLGDLHQPLHFAVTPGIIGSNVSVIFRDREMSMFDFWDKELTQATIRGEPTFWWGGWTHVKRTRVEFERDGALWKQNGAAEFWRWANETAEYMCHHVYLNPVTGRSILSEMKSGKLHVTEELFEQWKREMLSKMLVAGARTAIVLNAILAHREGMEQLHSGTAVTGVDEGDDAPEARNAVTGRRAEIKLHGGQPMHGFAAFGVNLCIFGAVLLVFHSLMRIWRGRGATQEADAAKSKNSGKKT